MSEKKLIRTILAAGIGLVANAEQASPPTLNTSDAPARRSDSTSSRKRAVAATGTSEDAAVSCSGTAHHRHSQSGRRDVTSRTAIPDLNRYKRSSGGRVFLMWCDRQPQTTNVKPDLLRKMTLHIMPSTPAAASLLSPR